MKSSNYNSSVRIMLVSKEFYGKPKLSVDEIINRIQTYDRDAVLIILSKWQVLLQKRYSQNPYFQLGLARLMMNRSQYKRLRNKIKRKPRIIFSHDVVLGLMKLNLQYNTEGGNNLDKNHQSRGLFKLLVSLNSHYVKDVLPEVDSRSEYRDELLEGLRYSMAKQALGINSSEVLHELYRGKRIIEHLDNEHLVFRRKFREHTNLEIEEYQEILFLLLLDWGFPVDVKSVDKVVFKNLGNYFSKSNISPEKVRSVIDLQGLRPEQFNSLNKTYNQAGRLEGQDDQWNYITFFNKQLVELEGGLICLSPASLIHQLSDGPYNIVRQQFKDDNDLHSLTDLPNWWGKAYEGYILERLKLMFGDRLTATNVLLNNGDESIDAVVELDDTVLLVEIKYPHWKFSSRIDPSRDEVITHIKKFVDRKKGLGQIKKFLEHKDSGNLRQNFDFKNKLIVPVLIMGEDYPPDPLNRQLINDYAKEQRLLPEGDTVLPFILLTSNEVEIMEGFVEQHGVTMLENFIRMFSGGFLDSENKPILRRPTTFLNVFVLNQIPVQNSKSLSNSLDGLYESLKSKFSTMD